VYNDIAYPFKDTNFSKKPMEKNISLQIDFKSYVNTIIMRTLFEGDKYGYEICKVVESRTNGWYKIKQPTLYSCLNRLETIGLISSYSNDESATHGGKRRYYSLTQKGIEEFTKSQDQWEYSRTIIDRLISDKQADLTRVPPPPVKRKAAKRPAPPIKKQNPSADVLTREIERPSDYTEESITNFTEESPKNRPFDDSDEVPAFTILPPYEEEIIAESIPEEPAPVSLTLDALDTDIDNLRAVFAGDSYSDSVRSQVFREMPSFAEAPVFDAYDNFKETKREDETVEEDEDEPVYVPPPQPQPQNTDAYILTDDERIAPPSYHDADVPMFGVPQPQPAKEPVREREPDPKPRDFASEYIAIEYRNILNRFIKTGGDGKRVRPEEVYTAEPAPIPEPDALHGEDVLVRLHRRAERPYVPENVDEVRVRPHDKEENADYNSKFYIYINRLRVMKSWIVCIMLMLLVGICYAALSLVAGVATKAENAYFIAGAVVPLALPLIAHTIYAINPDYKKRVTNTYVQSILSGAVLTMLAIIAVALALWAWGMNSNNLNEYVVRISVFFVLSLGFAVNALFYCILHRKKRFSA